MPKLSRLFIAFFILSLTAIIHADDVIIGKVVGVADGDTGFWGRWILGTELWGQG